MEDVVGAGHLDQQRGLGGRRGYIFRAIVGCILHQRGKGFAPIARSQNIDGRTANRRLIGVGHTPGNGLLRTGGPNCSRLRGRHDKGAGGVDDLDRHVAAIDTALAIAGR